ncbi:MAG: hypothetical protein K9M80_05245 [Candidatus Marinimicrobia bacterium]|nr:hypothetical protein [Candidatus Neomarinimicrobiota bacterium]
MKPIKKLKYSIDQSIVKNGMAKIKLSDIHKKAPNIKTEKYVLDWIKTNYQVKRDFINIDGEIKRIPPNSIILKQLAKKNKEKIKAKNKN